MNQPMKTILLQFCTILALLLTVMYSPLSAQNKTISYAADDSYLIADKPIELKHLKADLIIKPFDTLVQGTAEFTFAKLATRVDSLIFAAPELSFTSISINGAAAQWSMNGNDVVIKPRQPVEWQSSNSITFVYTAKPTEGLYFVGWNDAKGLKRKQIWAHRPDHWLPYYAGIITVEMNTTVDGRYKVFNNGERVKIIDNADGSRTWHYRMNHPHPYFSTSMVIGDYNYLSTSTGSGLPLELWYYPEQKEHVEPTYRYMPEMFSYFEDEFGVKYPWELYREAPVIDYMYGAMETTTSTIFGDYLMVDKRGFMGRNYVNVNAHELAHQWFGNYISHLKGKDVWLTESFATYYAKKFEQHIFGNDYYENVRNKELADVITAAQKDSYPVGHSAAGSLRWYPKGSLVLDMLRDVMGEEQFRAAIKYYLTAHPYQTAETADLLADIRKATGMSLEWFFEQWIYRGGEPRYQISYKQLSDNNAGLSTHVSINQIQRQDQLCGLFRMPISIEVHYTDGSSSSKTQWISAAHEEVIIPGNGNQAVEYVLFDPNRRILKTIEFRRTYNELAAQALKARNMIDRYDALLALREYPLSQKRTLLLQCYSNEKFHLTRGEIIAQLCCDYSPEVSKLLQQAINDADDKVRLAVVQNYSHVAPQLRTEYEKLLSDSSYLIIELALQNLCASFPENCSLYLKQTRNQTGWRGKNIRICWLETAVSNGNQKVLNELKDYTSSSYDFETRINSAYALKRLNILDEQTAANMLEGLSHWNFKIRAAESECLSYFYAQTAYRKLIDKVIEAGISAKSAEAFETIRKQSKMQ